MLAVILLSQHQVLSSKTVRPRASCGARCIGNAIKTWSAVCLEAPHLQFGSGARPHLGMEKWNRPTSVFRRLSLIQAVRGKLNPTGLALLLGIKIRSLDVFSQYSAFYLWFFHSEARMPSPASLSKRFLAAGTNRRLDLSHSWRASENPLRRSYKTIFLMRLQNSKFWLSRSGQVVYDIFNLKIVCNLFFYSLLFKWFHFF